MNVIVASNPLAPVGDLPNEPLRHLIQASLRFVSLCSSYAILALVRHVYRSRPGLLSPLHPSFLISQGHDQDILLLLDQVFAEPGWIPVFLGGLIYNIGLLIMSVAVWRSRIMAPWAAVLLALAALVGLQPFLTSSRLQESALPCLLQPSSP